MEMRKYIKPQLFDVPCFSFLTQATGDVDFEVDSELELYAPNAQAEAQGGAICGNTINMGDEGMQAQFCLSPFYDFRAALAGIQIVSHLGNTAVIVEGGPLGFDECIAAPGSGFPFEPQCPGLIYICPIADWGGSDTECIVQLLDEAGEVLTTCPSSNCP